MTTLTKEERDRIRMRTKHPVMGGPEAEAQNLMRNALDALEAAEARARDLESELSRDTESVLRAHEDHRAAEARAEQAERERDEALEATTTAVLPPEEQALCETDGIVMASLAYVCPVCRSVVSFPHASIGRIAKYLRDSSSDLTAARATIADRDAALAEAVRVIKGLLLSRDAAWDHARDFGHDWQQALDEARAFLAKHGGG